MSRNIYVVTRYVTDATLVTPIPNLGVHTSKKKALAHYKSVIEDRLRLGARLLHEHKLDQNIQNKDMIEALIASKDGYERLKIEVWRVQ
jgi:hypothetical protein